MVTRPSAGATLTVLRGSKRVATVRATARRGANRIAWNGKLGRRAATPGRYKLKLKLKSTNGQTASDQAKLTLNAGRR